MSHLMCLTHRAILIKWCVSLTNPGRSVPLSQEDFFFPTEVISWEVLLERRTGSAFILYRWNKLQLRSRTGVNSIGQTEPYLSGHNDHGTTSLCKIHLYFLQSIVTLRQVQRNSYGFVQWQPAVATIWNWKLRLKAQQNAEAGTFNQCHEDETEIPQSFSAPAHKTRTVTETFFLRSLGTFGLVSDNMEPEEKKSSVKKRQDDTASPV